MLIVIRFIILLALGWLAYRYIRRFLALDKPASTDQSSAEHNQQSLPMQRCAHCQVHLLEGESTRASGQFFCSEAHRDAWLETNPKDR